MPREASGGIEHHALIGSEVIALFMMIQQQLGAEQLGPFKPYGVMFYLVKVQIRAAASTHGVGKHVYIYTH